MNQFERNLYAIAFKDGMEKVWKIVQEIDAKHPEYPMPFEMFQKYKTLLGSVEDYIEENK